MPQLTRKFTLADLRAARAEGRKVAMLTCYDYTTARLMQESGVPMLLVGDSAANVILGHDSTVPISLRFLIELTAAVRRGAPNCLLMADMPFGSYGSDSARPMGFRNVLRVMKLSGADCVKLEVGPEHEALVRELAAAGVAVVAHTGLRPQTVNLLGGYRARGRTAADANAVVTLAERMQEAGAAAILLEAVPPEVAQRVVERTRVPVIGCGAGPACHAAVIVTHDGIGLTSHQPRFVPHLGDLGTPMKEMFARFVRIVTNGEYPAAEHNYEMMEGEKTKFVERP